jgi:enamine deaminase RidA (YjgF/YER057c/UK114 family)
MKLTGIIAGIAAIGMFSGIFAGCAGDEARMEAIAERQARKVLDEYKQSFKPETFGFGVPWEKDFSYAQGVKVGNMIFVAGQLSHSQTKDKTWGYDTVTVGEDFETQYRQTLENIKAVLAHYGATMDDVVFLQNFFDPEADGKQIGAYGPAVKKLINEYFPRAQHAMTNMQITNLFGKNQFVETNAIAVVRE